ncbi:hypothetical protein B0H16DRAFT_1480362 [Mycena metata]|uniref:Uncharacterized protein n=1 Tax=Mycena metata TaxID=1033252 RepID=A0AAD7H3H4_9AGAR|nr:hypothetical protein B0H16DRAFT_1480362 [Mycena metata]
MSNRIQHYVPGRPNLWQFNCRGRYYVRLSQYFSVSTHLDVRTMDPCFDVLERDLSTQVNVHSTFVQHDLDLQHARPQSHPEGPNHLHLTRDRDLDLGHLGDLFRRRVYLDFELRLSLKSSRDLGSDSWFNTLIDIILRSLASGFTAIIVQVFRVRSKLVQFNQHRFNRWLRFNCIHWIPHRLQPNSTQTHPSNRFAALSSKCQLHLFESPRAPLPLTVHQSPSNPRLEFLSKAGHGGRYGLEEGKGMDGRDEETEGKTEKVWLWVLHARPPRAPSLHKAESAKFGPSGAAAQVWCRREGHAVRHGLGEGKRMDWGDEEGRGRTVQQEGGDAEPRVNERVSVRATATCVHVRSHVTGRGRGVRAGGTKNEGEAGWVRVKTRETRERWGAVWAWHDGVREGGERRGKGEGERGGGDEGHREMGRSQCAGTGSSVCVRWAAVCACTAAYTMAGGGEGVERGLGQGGRDDEHRTCPSGVVAGVGVVEGLKLACCTADVAAIAA